MKSLERQLLEKDTELRELRKNAGKTKPGASANVAQLLAESGLPEPAIARLRKKLPATEKADVIRLAISEERTYVRDVRTSVNGVALVESYKLLGLNEREAGIAAGVEVAVKNIDESRSRLADAAKRLGLSEKEAAIFSQI